MAYLNDVGAADALVSGISDEHWRVRMTCIQSLARIRVLGLSADSLAGLDDEHPRVRSATVLALGRVGNGEARSRLARVLDEDPENPQVESAIASIEERESD